MRDLIADYIQRPTQYAYADGLIDVALGLTYQAWAILFFVMLETPPHAGVNRAPTVAFIAVTFLVLAVRVVAFRLIRTRITYRRTGYVAFRTRTAVRLAIIGLALGAALGWALAFAGRTSLRESWLLLAGLVIALAYFVEAIRRRLPRYFVLGAVSLLAASLLQVAGVGWGPGLSWYLLTMGTATMIAGGWTFYVYLRRTQPPEAPAQ